MPYRYAPPVRSIIVAQSVSYVGFACLVLAWIADSILCTRHKYEYTDEDQQNQLATSETCFELTFRRSDDDDVTTVHHTYSIPASLFALLAVVSACLLATLLLSFPAVPDLFHKNSTNRWRGGVGGGCLLAGMCGCLVLVLMDLEADSSTRSMDMNMEHSGTTTGCTQENLGQTTTPCNDTDEPTSFSAGAYCFIVAIALWTVACILVCAIAPKLMPQRRRPATTTATMRRDQREDDDETVATMHDNNDDDEEELDNIPVPPIPIEIEMASPDPMDSRETTTTTTTSGMTHRSNHQPSSALCYDWFQCCRCSSLGIFNNNDNNNSQHQSLLHTLTILLYFLHIAASTALLTLSSDLVSKWTNLVGAMWLLLLVPQHAYGERYYKDLQNAVDSEETYYTKQRHVLVLQVSLQLAVLAVLGLVLGIYYGVV